jgi:hypothetical protein
VESGLASPTRRGLVPPEHFSHDLVNLKIFRVSFGKIFSGYSGQEPGCSYIFGFHSRKLERLSVMTTMSTLRLDIFSWVSTFDLSINLIQLESSLTVGPPRSRPGELDVDIFNQYEGPL